MRMMGEERYNPGFLTNEERSREERRTAEMVQSFAKRGFRAAKRTISVEVARGQDSYGYTQPRGSHQVDANSNQKVTAYPKIGFELSRWEDNGQFAGNTSSLTIQMNNTDHMVYAHFTSIVKVSTKTLEPEPKSRAAWKENDNRTSEKRPLKSFSVKVNKNARIDIHLREGLFEDSNHATYITLSIFREGNKTRIHMKKAQASQLSLLLSQLVAEGNNFDYQRLKSKYPNQDSWHIY